MEHHDLVDSIDEFGSEMFGHAGHDCSSDRVTVSPLRKVMDQV